MNTRTREAILSALTRRSRTVAQLADHTKLARSTLSIALPRLLTEGAVDFEPGSWPRRYRITKDSAVTIHPRIAPLGADVIEVELRELPDAIPKWNASGLSSKLGIEISPDMEPRKLADELATGARSLASMSYALYRVSSDPEWFAKLGGLTLD